MPATGAGMAARRIGINPSPPSQAGGRRSMSPATSGAATAEATLAYRFRKPSEYIENKWFSLKVILLGFARGRIDLVPGLGHPGKPCKVRRSGHEVAGEPGVHRVDEGLERCRLGPVEAIAQRMQRARVNGRQAIERIHDRLAQVE